MNCIGSLLNCFRASHRINKTIEKLPENHANTLQRLQVRDKESDSCPINKEKDGTATRQARYEAEKQRSLIDKNLSKKILDSAQVQIQLLAILGNSEFKKFTALDKNTQKKIRDRKNEHYFPEKTQENFTPDLLFKSGIRFYGKTVINEAGEKTPELFSSDCAQIYFPKPFAEKIAGISGDLTGPTTLFNRVKKMELGIIECELLTTDNKKLAAKDIHVIFNPDKGNVKFLDKNYYEIDKAHVLEIVNEKIMMLEPIDEGEKKATQPYLSKILKNAFS